MQPTDGSDRRSVAARLRELIGSDSDPAEIASRLRIDEAALRTAIDVESPRPTMDVVIAVVREYGVDANWLLTGDYDLATHRRALAADRAGTIQVIRDVSRRRVTPLSVIALPELPTDRGPSVDT